MTTRRNLALILLPVLAVVSLVVVFVVLRMDEAPSAPSDQAPARSWRISYSQQGTRHPHAMIPGSPTEEQPFGVEFAGQLRLQEQGTTEDGTRDFVFRLQVDSWRAAGMGTFDQLKPTRIDGVVTMREGSEVDAFYVDDDTFEQLGPLLVDVFALLDARLKRDVSEWQEVTRVQERDVEVRWSQTDANTYRKHAEVNATDFTYGVTGDYVVTTIGELWRAVSIERTQQFRLQGKPVSRDATKFHLEASASQSLGQLIQLARADLTREDVDGTTFRSRQQRQAWARVLGGVQAPELLSALEGIESGKMNDSIDDYQRVKAFFHLYPEQMGAFRALCTESGVNSTGCGHVLTAANAVGSEEAQGFLRDVFGALDGDAEQQKQIIPHLSMTDHPSEETVKFIEQLAESGTGVIKSTANLALGSVAHQLRGTDPDTSRRILNEATSRLTHAQSDSERAHQLRVVGNIGLPDQFQALKPYLAHENPDVRGPAVAALRHVDSDEARDALIRVIEQDQVTRIRQIAAESLKFTPLNEAQLTWVGERLWVEKDITVLKHLAQVLVGQPVPSPAAWEALHAFTRACGHPDLCGYLEQLLTSAVH